MNRKRLLLAVLLAAFVLTAFAGPGMAQQKDTKAQPQPQEKEKVYIPKDVKAILEQGLAARQGLTGIPVTVTNHLFFPYYRAQGLMHDVFALKIKNADLGFAAAPAAVPAAKPAEKKEEKKDTTEAFEAVPAADMQAVFDLFMQFRAVENNVPGKVVKEVYVPTDIVVPAAEYKPENVEDYFVAYDLPAGSYLLCLAVRSADQKKVGTTYFEFTTPDAGKMEGKLETTPIIITKDVGQMQTQENRTVVHRGYFAYLVLKITPNAAATIPAKSNMDILYFVLGAKPNDQGKFALETSFEVKQGDKVIIPYASTVYEAPYVSLPLPLKQTVKITSGTSERMETRDLAPGKYTFVAKITDKTTGATVTKNMEFEVI
jgi:hypothetical protein